MDVHQLRYFLAVVRTGSFVRAAEEEGVAQPSLSQGVKKLESDLGVQLFNRLGRSVSLTQYGHSLVAHAEAVMRETREARKAIEQLSHPDAGTLVVGAIPTVLPYAAAEPLADFRKRFPRVTLDIRELTTDKLIEQLRAGILDLAILALPLKQPELVCSELFREPLLLAVPANDPRTLPAALTSLQDERMLLLREGHCLRDQVLTTCTRAKLQFNQVFESDQLASLMSMVASGFGVSLVPESAARHAHGCKLLPLQPPSFRRIGYAQVAGHTSTPVKKEFVQHLRHWKWLRD